MKMKNYPHELLEDPRELSSYCGWSEDVYQDFLACQRGTLSFEAFNRKYKRQCTILVIDMTGFTASTISAVWVYGSDAFKNRPLHVVGWWVGGSVGWCGGGVEGCHGCGGGGACFDNGAMQSEATVSTVWSERVCVNPPQVEENRGLV